MVQNHKRKNRRNAPQKGLSILQLVRDWVKNPYSIAMSLLSGMALFKKDFGLSPEEVEEEINEITDRVLDRLRREGLL